MIKKFIFLTLTLFFSVQGYGQEQKPLTQRITTRLDNAWFGNGTVIKIRENQTKCETLVRRLKSSGKVSDDLINKYMNAKAAYDIVLDTMLNDVNRAESVLDIFNLLARSQERKNRYNELGQKADQVCVIFKTSAETVLNDNMGLIDDIISWTQAIIPSWIRTLAVELRDALKFYYKNRINSLRLKDWSSI